MFIEVTDALSNTVVSVNLNNIVAVSERGNGAQLGIVGGGGIKVTNSYSDVMSKINSIGGK